MARAWLHDDVLPVGVTVRPSEAQLAEDPDHDTFQVLPTLTVRARTRIGYTDDGDPIFRMTTIVEGLAVLWEERRETDDVAGLSKIKAKATILYDGDKITESAKVTASTGGVFQVTSVAQVHDHVILEMERADA